MALDLEQEQELQSSLKVARVMWAALSFAAPLAFLAVFQVRILKGNAGLFLSGFSHIPWRHSMVFPIVCLSIVTLAFALVLPERIANNGKYRNVPVVVKLRVKQVMTAALLEYLPIYGFVLGAAMGPAVASLSLVCLLIPMAAGLFSWPSEAQWREHLDRNQRA